MKPSARLNPKGPTPKGPSVLRLRPKGPAAQPSSSHKWLRLNPKGPTDGCGSSLRSYRLDGCGSTRQVPPPTQRATKGFSGAQCPSFRYLIRRNPSMPLRVAYRRVLGLIA
ncbi:hypothetical protein T484DRAFT_3457552 [Baffinella frigidus]|nr:hypothetical protein T484DRAFT_3457552 [Cryptophyta sp. CCMP2293]